MTGNPEFTFAQLLDWVEERLSPAAAQHMAQQVTKANPTVQQQVQWLTAFLKLSDQLVLTAPPPAVRATLMQQFANYAHARQQPGLWQRLAATLTFDSVHQPALTGLRAGESEPARHYVFATAPADVAINILPHQHGQQLDLFGQILPNRETLALDGFVIQLLRTEREIAITVADEIGEFLFRALEPGDYELIFSTEGLEIELPVFALSM